MVSLPDFNIFNRAQLLDYDVALNMTTYLKNEDKIVPWRAFLDSIQFIKGMISKQGSYVALRVTLFNMKCKLEHY